MIEAFEKNYRILKVLSTNNDAEVLLLRHRSLQKNIVYRCYPKQLVSYDRLKAFRHRNLPEIFDTFSENGKHIVLEEYIDGLTVAEVLETGKYTPRGAKKVLAQVCDAVAALHSLGIIHRDIKPENVIITETGKVKLIDLNASKYMAPNKKQPTVLLGTIGYAAYEQLGLSESDERTDIFALGVLLNVMLTGEHPSKKLAKGRMGKIVLKCTQIDPNSRYKSVKKLLSAL